jgi:outer membrane receptor for ferrienterochelin and colicins
MRLIVFTILNIFISNTMFAQVDIKTSKEKTYTSTEVVVSGNMKKMSKKDSPLPIEVYRTEYFQKAAVSNLLDATQQITGLRPQINCSVCNTGDIHLNGMEGPYTAVLIDGMPIVSSLSTVYGLSGIPLSMIERVEVIKGPGAAMYGSEAMAGIINIITKSTSSADKIYIESSLSSQLESSNDIAMKWKMGAHTQSLLSLNYFNFDNKLDVNKDGFTDIALQKRFSLFNKYTFDSDRSLVNFAYRLMYEDRWGGELNWNENFRAGDSIYGETIQTKRVEIISSIKPNKDKPLEFQTSYVYHNQSSTYGITNFNAYQHTLFLQSIYRFQKKNHDILTGLSLKTNVYDDNTILTRTDFDTTRTKLRTDIIPGVFIQDEWKLNTRWKLLLAMRFDYDFNQGFVSSPRSSLQYKVNEQTQYRLGAGRGFRVVNVFTEDHAALSGDRKIQFAENLNPESTINSFFSLDHIFLLKSSYIKSEFNLFNTYFFNRIIANYDLDPNKIIYKNLDGYSISQGINAKFDWQSTERLNIQFGCTLLDAFEKTDSNRIDILFSSRFSGNFSVSYKFSKINLNIDYTGVFYSPMRLPVLPNDFREEYSPWYAIHTIQATKIFSEEWEVYVAMKNIFDFLPQNPLMRSFDPFDKQVNINNPNNYTFDTTYGYAPMQGRRMLIGFRYKIRSI